MNLPVELLEIITKKLSFTDLSSFSMVNKQISDIVLRQLWISKREIGLKIENYQKLRDVAYAVVSLESRKRLQDCLKWIGNKVILSVSLISDHQDSHLWIQLSCVAPFVRRFELTDNIVIYVDEFMQMFSLYWMPVMKNCEFFEHGLFYNVPKGFYHGLEGMKLKQLSMSVMNTNHDWNGFFLSLPELTQFQLCCELHSRTVSRLLLGMMTTPTFLQHLEGLSLLDISGVALENVENLLNSLGKHATSLKCLCISHRELAGFISPSSLISLLTHVGPRLEHFGFEGMIIPKEADQHCHHLVNVKALKLACCFDHDHPTSRDRERRWFAACPNIRHAVMNFVDTIQVLPKNLVSLDCRDAHESSFEPEAFFETIVRLPNLRFLSFLICSPDLRLFAYQCGERTMLERLYVQFLNGESGEWEDVEPFEVNGLYVGDFRHMVWKWWDLVDFSGQDPFVLCPASE